MAVRNYALGSLEPVVYFINSRGAISLPPSTNAALAIKDRMAKRGWELREAATLDAIDRLQKHMQEQERRASERNLEHEENLLAQQRKSVRDRLVSRMVSSSTRPYEREFIQHYLMLRDEKREEYRKRYTGDVAYFEALEFNKNSHHIRDAINAIPEMKDVACKRCGQARRVNNSTLCANCGGIGSRE